MARKTGGRAQAAESSSVLYLDYGSSDVPATPPIAKVEASSSSNLLDTQHSIDVAPQMYAGRKAPPAYDFAEEAEAVVKSEHGEVDHDTLQQEAMPISYAPWTQGSPYPLPTQTAHGPYMQSYMPHPPQHPIEQGFPHFPHQVPHLPYGPPAPGPPPPQPPFFHQTYPQPGPSDQTAWHQPYPNQPCGYAPHVWPQHQLPPPLPPVYPHMYGPSMSIPPRPPPISSSPDVQHASSSTDSVWLEKKLKKHQKKIAKRERKQQKLAAQNGTLSEADSISQDLPEMPLSENRSSAKTCPVLSDEEKDRAVVIIEQLHREGVAPFRLMYHGVHRTLIEDCCSDLRIQGRTDGEARDEPTVAEQNVEEVALTPLEQLRKKALASRLAKVAAAEDQQWFAERISREAWPALDAASEEKLQQAAEAINAIADESTAETRTTRKRVYKDIDACDDGEAISLDADLDLPSLAQRQRVSYADTFSSKPEAPKGDVDLTAPIPALTPEPTIVTTAQVKRTRPVAADFVDAFPEEQRTRRFLDVPHGLNTVVDISDDETDDEDMPDSGMQGESLHALRRKTGDELNAIYRSLKGLAQSSEEDTATTVLDVRASDSYDDLTRKELEIKLLTQRIQLRELQRKAKQATPTPTGSVANSIDNGQSATKQLSTRGDVGQSESKQVTPGSGSVQLDPALQQKRQALLTLLAASRKKALTPDDNSAAASEALDDSRASSPDEDSIATSSNAVEPKTLFHVTSADASKNGYQPLFPTLFRTIKTLPSYLGIDLRFRRNKKVDINKRWCPAESGGLQCQNDRCTMIHASDLDPDAKQP